jgi:hypothetical protein
MKLLIEEMKKTLGIMFPILIVGLSFMIFCNYFCYFHILKKGEMTTWDYIDGQIIPTTLTIILTILSFKFRKK